MAKKKKIKMADDSGTDTVAATPSLKPNNDWEHEDNARTLQRAGEILADPKKLKGAHKHIKKAKAGFRSIDQLIKHRNETYGAGGVGDPEMEE